MVRQKGGLLRKEGASPSNLTHPHASLSLLPPPPTVSQVFPCSPSMARLCYCCRDASCPPPASVVNAHRLLELDLPVVPLQDWIAFEQNQRASIVALPVAALQPPPARAAATLIAASPTPPARVAATLFAASPPPPPPVLATVAVASQPPPARAAATLVAAFPTPPAPVLATLVASSQPPPARAAATLATASLPPPAVDMTAVATTVTNTDERLAELERAHEENEREKENYRVASTLLFKPNSTGVIPLSVPPEMAQRLARHFQLHWQDGKLKLGNTYAYGYNQYGKTLAQHNSKQQQHDTLLLTHGLLPQARRNLPCFQKMDEYLVSRLQV